LLNRLTHRAHILESMGESFRFRQCMQREAKKKSDGLWTVTGRAHSLDGGGGGLFSMIKWVCFRLTKTSGGAE